MSGFGSGVGAGWDRGKYSEFRDLGWILGIRVVCAECAFEGGKCAFGRLDCGIWWLFRKCGLVAPLGVSHEMVIGLSSVDPVVLVLEDELVVSRDGSGGEAGCRILPVPPQADVSSIRHYVFWFAPGVVAESDVIVDRW